MVWDFIILSHTVTVIYVYDNLPYDPIRSVTTFSLLRELLDTAMHFLKPARISAIGPSHTIRQFDSTIRQ